MSAPSAYPRDLAVRIITRVLSDREPLDEALAAVSGQVSEAARGWLLEVTSGTLRWKGRLDLVLDATALKKKPSGWLRKILLLGAYQLVVQERTSPGAVVSETVNEVKRKEGEAPGRFANALLRKVAEHAARWKAMPAPSPQGKEAAAWASLPDWLWARLVRDHGSEWARIFALASLERPKIWIRGRSGFSPDGASSGPVPGAWELNEGGAISEKPGFREGQFFVQDISSQTLVADIAEAVREAGIGTRALDLCAAPGGKALGLAWNGFSVSGSDRDDVRLRLLRQNIERVGQGSGEGAITLVSQEDLSKFAAPWPFDLVWIDAPCTGTGIIRRHPDVRWLRQEKDLLSLVSVQRGLLKDAWQKVRPGSFLAYSVCSVLKEEGPEAIRAAGLAGHVRREWFLAPQNPPGGDGFWAALLHKGAD